VVEEPASAAQKRLRNAHTMTETVEETFVNAVRWHGLWNTYAHSDLTLIAHGRELLATRARFVRTSPELKRMAEDATPGVRGRPSTFDLGTEYRFEAVRNMVVFASTDALHSLKAPDIVDTWRLARAYGLVRLATFCEAKAESDASPAGAVAAYAQAVEHGAKHIQGLLREYIVSHHSACLQAAEATSVEAKAEFDEVNLALDFARGRFNTARAAHDDAKLAARAAREAATARWYDTVLGRTADACEEHLGQKARGLARIGGSYEDARAVAKARSVVLEAAKVAFALGERVWQAHLDAKAVAASELKNRKKGAAQLFTDLAAGVDHGKKKAAMAKWKAVYIDMLIRGV